MSANNLDTGAPTRSKQSLRFKTSRPIYLVTSGLVVVVFLALASHLSAVEPSKPHISMVTPKSNSSDPTATEGSCTLANLETLLHKADPEQMLLPSSLPFTQSEQIQLGGALFMNFGCNNGESESNFVAEWFGDSEDWKLKKISQLPNRQLGNF